MLTDTDAAKLRNSASTSARRRFKGPTQRVVLAGGPLDGVTATVEQRDAKGLYLGWCVVTDRGPTQALYRLERPGRFIFAELVESFDWSK